MAITMSGANVDSSMSTRDSFTSATVDTGVLGGGAVANTHRTGFLGLGGSEATGAPLAGVTAEFASAFSGVVDTYAADVRSKIDQLSSPEINQAFQGAGINAALANFIEGVKEVANSYLESLANVEVAITAEVAKAYADQDTELSGQLGSDTGTVSSSSVHIS